MEEELSFVIIFSTAWSWQGYVSSTLMIMFKYFVVIPIT